MQRDVEIEIDTVDKSGGFIGALYVNKTENAAVGLVREGLASVHAFSAEGLSWSRHLFEAEEEAKKARRNVSSVFLELLVSYRMKVTEFTLYLCVLADVGRVR